MGSVECPSMPRTVSRPLAMATGTNSLFPGIQVSNLLPPMIIPPFAERSPIMVKVIHVFGKLRSGFGFNLFCTH